MQLDLQLKCAGILAYFASFKFILMFLVRHSNAMLQGISFMSRKSWRVSASRVSSAMPRRNSHVPRQRENKTNRLNRIFIKNCVSRATVLDLKEREQSATGAGGECCTCIKDPYDL